MSSSKNDTDVPESLQCTAKCKEALTSKTALKGRDRQYCLLLLREDKVSIGLRDKLKHKVDVSKLMTADYIKPITIEKDNILTNQTNGTCAKQDSEQKPTAKMLINPKLTAANLAQEICPTIQMATGKF